MKLLLDTHAFLCFVSGDKRFGKAARLAADREDTRLVVSAASIWELSIKSSLGRLQLSMPIEDYVADKKAIGYQLMSITAAHAAAVASLPHHHDDPFDRLLAVQALAKQMPCVTRDKIFKKYGVKTIW